MPVAIPDSHRDLLERPLYCMLSTLRPEGRLQTNPMWFTWDGEFVRFTHTRTRQKYRSLSQDPRATMAVLDPEMPYRYLELRGQVIDIQPDPQAALFDLLAARYGSDLRGQDAPDRVVLVFNPEQVAFQ